MEFDASGTLYGVDELNLYTIDPTVPSASLIGPLGTTGFAIALAIDDNGVGYMYDILDDSAYSINLATGSTTNLGPIGFDANFGQGMYYDPATDMLFLTAFNVTTFTGELRTMNRATGNTTLLGALATTSSLPQISWA